MEDAMIWAKQNKKLELLSVLQDFFEAIDEEDYETESEEESEDESDMEGEDIKVITDNKGFMSLY